MTDITNYFPDPAFSGTVSADLQNCTASYNKDGSLSLVGDTSPIGSFAQFQLSGLASSTSYTLAFVYHPVGYSTSDGGPRNNAVVSDDMTFASVSGWGKGPDVINTLVFNTGSGSTTAKIVLRGIAAASKTTIFKNVLLCTSDDYAKATKLKVSYIDGSAYSMTRS